MATSGVHHNAANHLEIGQYIAETFQNHERNIEHFHRRTSLAILKHRHWDTPPHLYTSLGSISHCRAVSPKEQNECVGG